MPLTKRYIKSKKFLPLILDEATPLMSREINENKREMGQKMADLLWGRKSAKYRIGKENKQLDFLGILIDYYSELSDSLENMKIAAVLINQYPYGSTLKKKNINKAQYLSYHVGNYLNEVYIFRERMQKFLKWLEKEFKNIKKAEAVELVKKHERLIDNLLKPINDNRDAHVHTKRFEDLSIEQLKYIYLLMTSAKQDKFARSVEIIEKLTYRKTRRDWFKKIGKNNSEIEKAMQFILEDVKYPIFQYLYVYKKVIKN